MSLALVVMPRVGVGFQCWVIKYVIVLAAVCLFRDKIREMGMVRCLTPVIVISASS